MNIAHAVSLALMGFALGTVFSATCCAMYVVSGTLFMPKLGQSKGREALLTAGRLGIALGLLFVMALYKPALQFDPSNVVVATAAITTLFALPGLLIVRDVFSVHITCDDLRRELNGQR